LACTLPLATTATARLIEIRESIEGRKRRTQRVIAWKGGAAKSIDKEGKDNAETQSTQRNRSEERIRELLETERGPLPLHNF